MFLVRKAFRIASAIFPPPITHSLEHTLPSTTSPVLAIWDGPLDSARSAVRLTAVTARRESMLGATPEVRRQSMLTSTAHSVYVTLC
jgi:hypothetical protein